MKFIIIFLMALGFSHAQANTKVSIDTKNSKIQWAGEKIVPGNGHKGTIQVQSGHILLKKKEVVGGEFVINMSSIDSTDLSGSMEKKLIGHLQSPDFFDVKNHPTASFKAKKVMKKGKGKYSVTGDLTIRGVTRPETFSLSIKPDGKMMVATGKISFNRKKYKVQYNSEADFLSKAISIPKDKVIKDTISLDLSLKTKAQ